jgi:hypothetical protein
MTVLWVPQEFCSNHIESRLPMKNFTTQYSAIAGLTALLAGCSAIETVPPANGTDEYVFACSKVAGQPGCETRAREVCPEGYEILSSEEDFDRKELRIRCSSEDGGV